MSNRRRRRGINLPTPSAVTASSGPSLIMASPSEPLVDFDKRTISGLVVPFGKAGETSGGRLRFAAGSLTISSPRRVKLLREHLQSDSVGYATSYEELTADEVDKRLAEAGQDPLGVAGIWGTHHVPEDDHGNGDRALREAANGVRDAFSVGVQLDDATLLKLRRTQPGGVVDARGALREVSLVSVPAFDDARVGAVAGADLVVSAWTTTTTDPSAAGAGSTTASGGNMFTESQRRRLAALLAKGSALTNAEQAELGQLTQLATAAGVTITGATITGELDDGGDGGDGGDAGDASAGGTAQASTGPAVLPAYAGAAVVTGEPSPYTFSDGGPSLVADMFAAEVRRDSEAGERVATFNAQLADGNVPTAAALMTAAATTGDVDGAGTDLPQSWGAGPIARPDLMRALVDVKRPFISRLNRIPISSPVPFVIPKVGEFTGVGDHAEGTPHRAAGSLTIEGGDVVQPKATSGAWEVSRELLDSANPALDRIAVRAMLRDYARQTEGKFLALFAALAATGDAAHVYGVNTVMELRQALLAFVNDDEEAADIIGVAKGLLGTFMADVDGVERAQIPFYTPANAIAQTNGSGYVGFGIDGQPVFRAGRLDSTAGLGATYGVMARSEGLLWAESNVMQFRFDEVLGPGVVKFALWAYNGAAIIDTADVKLITSGADPTP